MIRALKKEYVSFRKSRKFYVDLLNPELTKFHIFETKFMPVIKIDIFWKKLIFFY